MVSRSDRWIDLALRATTFPVKPGCADAVPAGSGWNLRYAGPRWYEIWVRDPERLSRLRIVLLPASWPNLDRAEVLALTRAQIGPADRRAAAALPLWRAQRRLRPALCRRS